MNPYERRRLRVLAQRARGPRILDVGCAQQPNPGLAAREVVGLDMAEMALAPPYTEHVVGDAEQVDKLLAGRQFETVIMGEFIEHVQRPYDVLRAFRPLVAEGGKLLVTTPNPLGIPQVVAELMGLRRYYYTTDHTYAFPPRWVWRLLTGSGYRVVRTQGLGASLLGVRLPAPAAWSYLVLYEAEPA